MPDEESNLQLRSQSQMTAAAPAFDLKDVLPPEQLFEQVPEQSPQQIEDFESKKIN